MIQAPISHEQATKLAAFIASLRPDWDKPGVLDAIGRARNRGSACEVAVAAIRCATSAHARTPAVIAMDGEHWRAPKPDTNAMGDRRLTINGRCRDCGRMHPAADPCIQPSEQTKAASATGAKAAREALKRARSGEDA